ncbi:MAG: glycerophosphodiester phosphodiesterase family protein [Pseudomonadota bacterium]
MNLLPKVIALTVSLLWVAGCTSEEPKEPRPQEATEAWFTDVNLSSYLDCARENGVTLIQAHRAGPRHGFAENSLGAIAESLADGALFLEIDVAQTSDGTLVLMHDDTLDRTTTGQGRLSTFSSAELADLRLVDDQGQVTAEKIPSLAEALAFLEGRGIAQIDLKKGVSNQQIARALEEANAIHRAMIITYSLNDAIELHQWLPEVMLSVGIDDISELSILEASGVNSERLTAWLGLGTGKPDLDQQLAQAGIETSYGDFRAERRGNARYRLMAENGAEILSVDNVEYATNALNAARASRDLLEICSTAQG